MRWLVQSPAGLLAGLLKILVQEIAGFPGIGVRFVKSLRRVVLQLFRGLSGLFTSVIFLALRARCKRKRQDEQSRKFHTKYTCNRRAKRGWTQAGH
jgi:hypothetical protein